MENKNEMTKPLWMQMLGRGQRVHRHENIEHLLVTNKIFIEDISEVKKKNFDELKDILSRPFKYRKTYSEGIEEEDRDRRYIPLNTKILKGDYFFPEELCNLKNKYMDTKNLQNAINKQAGINELKEIIETTEASHDFGQMFIMFGVSQKMVHTRFMNFKTFKKQYLAILRKELNRLEKEFAKL